MFNSWSTRILKFFFAKLPSDKRATVCTVARLFCSSCRTFNLYLVDFMFQRYRSSQSIQACYFLIYYQYNVAQFCFSRHSFMPTKTSVSLIMLDLHYIFMLCLQAVALKWWKMASLFNPVWSVLSQIFQQKLFFYNKNIFYTQLSRGCIFSSPLICISLLAEMQSLSELDRWSFLTWSFNKVMTTYNNSLMLKVSI